MPGAHGLGVLFFQKHTVPIPYNLVTGEFQKPPHSGYLTRRKHAHMCITATGLIPCICFAFRGVKFRFWALGLSACCSVAVIRDF